MSIIKNYESYKDFTYEDDKIYATILKYAGIKKELTKKQYNEIMKDCFSSYIIEKLMQPELLNIMPSDYTDNDEIAINATLGMCGYQVLDGVLYLAGQNQITIYAN